MSPIDMLAISGKSVLISQTVDAVQQLVVFQTPPPSEPRYAIAGSSGSPSSTFVRPALVPAPKPSPASGFGPSSVNASGSSESVEPGTRVQLFRPVGTPDATRWSCTFESSSQCGSKRRLFGSPW